jgi:hypothetical protein
MTTNIPTIKQKLEEAYSIQDFKTACSIGFSLHKDDHDHISLLNLGVSLYYTGYKELSKIVMIDALIKCPDDDSKTKQTIQNNLKYY